MSELLYEKKLNRNALTRYLHSFRYRQLVDLVAQKFKDRPFTVLDIGCGPGGAFDAMSDSQVRYRGVDIREDFIRAANLRYQSENCSFDVADVTEPGFDFSGFDMIIALETFEHVPEAKLVRVIERIADARPEFLLCSVPIETGPSVAIKNFGSRLMGYDRSSGDTFQTINAALSRLNKIPPHGVGHLGFNWIWLEQTLRHNMKIVESRSLPYRVIPKALSPSVMFKCVPYEEDAQS